STASNRWRTFGRPKSWRPGSPPLRRSKGERANGKMGVVCKKAESDRQHRKSHRRGTGMRIQTTRNVVITEQPEPDDVFVQISLLGPGDEPGLWHPRSLGYEPVSNYQAAVDWAVGIADQFAKPIY